METIIKHDITVGAKIDAQVEKVWDLWTNPFHIVHWYTAMETWHTTYAENNPVSGGHFSYRMESRDGKEGFDFSGRYDEVEKYKYLSAILDDGRKVNISFLTERNTTDLTESFEVETVHTEEMQRQGWQAIIDNFKKYVESYKSRDIIHFETYINAPVHRVYENLIGEKSYKEWISAFNPSSHFEGSWKKGSRIMFLGEDHQNGGEAGMVAMVKENIPDKFISLEYIGWIRNGKEISTGREIDDWKGLLENYSLREINGNTILSLDMDSLEEYKSYMNETWPKALRKLKDLCEK